MLLRPEKEGEGRLALDRLAGGLEGVLFVQVGHPVYNGPGRLAVHHGLGFPALGLSPRPHHLDGEELRLSGVVHQRRRKKEPGQGHQQQRRCRHPRQAQGPAVPLPPPWTGGFDVVLLHGAFSFWGKAMVWRRVSSPQRRRKSSAVSPKPGRIHARAVKPLSCQ